jgi:hypothetical protein
VGTELVQHSQPLDDPVIEVNEFGFAELINVYLHGILQIQWAGASMATFPWRLANLPQSGGSCHYTVLFWRTLVCVPVSSKNTFVVAVKLASKYRLRGHGAGASGLALRIIPFTGAPISVKHIATTFFSDELASSHSPV